MSPTAQPPIALTIAGSDSGGGAGIQADLKTFAALRVHGTCAITALTAQNTLGVQGVAAMAPAFVRAQIDSVCSDMRVAAAKLGMLADREVIEAVADALDAWSLTNVVLDPVMVAKGGATLLKSDAVDALRERLLPRATMLTPNLPEAAVLLGWSFAQVQSAPQRAVEGLRALGVPRVVLKGGHAGGQQSEDLYFDGETWERLAARRVLTSNTHGTGCTFSAALTAALAHGLTPLESAREAKAYVSAAIEAGSRWRLGAGHGPVHHFHAWWKGE